MPEPKNPRNIPARDNLAADAPTAAPASPGDANPDLARPSTPGPVPVADDASAREHAGPSEAATADIEERQRSDHDPGRTPADAPLYR
jgi:hypothetical protein